MGLVTCANCGADFDPVAPLGDCPAGGGAPCINYLARRAVAAVNAADLGTPTARKTGRSARWPYVPVIVDTDGRQAQVLGVAYATRPEAVAAAERHLAALRASLVRRLVEPRHRSLRAQYGLERELLG